MRARTLVVQRVALALNGLSGCVSIYAGPWDGQAELEPCTRRAQPLCILDVAWTWPGRGLYVTERELMPPMSSITIALHKPYGVLSRFTPDGSAHRPLAALGLPRGVWPVGRLDADSEGLLVLSDDKALVDRLLSPRRAHTKTYLAQVERVPDEAALALLRSGVMLDGKPTLPAAARLLSDEPGLPPRDPPIRFRKRVPTAWIELSLTEGRNRQVRRMTAAVGFPTLRLVRAAIGRLGLFHELADLDFGRWRALTPTEVGLLLQPALSPTMGS